jgi:hypothetical protein
MHTLRVEVDGTTYYVHHNSDWSGDAIVNWKDAKEDHEITLPGRILVACSKQELLDTVIRKIADLY